MSTSDEKSANWRSELKDYAVGIDSVKDVIENYRKKIEECNNQIRQTSENIKIKESQLENVSKNIAEKNNILAFSGTKMKVQEEVMGNLRKEIDEKSAVLEKVAKESHEKSQKLLLSSMEFATNWNCTMHGRNYRINANNKVLEEMLADDDFDDNTALAAVQATSETEPKKASKIIKTEPPEVKLTQPEKVLSEFHEHYVVSKQLEGQASGFVSSKVIQAYDVLRPKEQSEDDIVVLEINEGKKALDYVLKQNDPSPTSSCQKKFKFNFKKKS